MENSVYVGLSRQMALRREMDVIANNIANMNTPAYKAEQMVFREYVTQPERGERVSLVQDVGLSRDLSDGPLQTTGNPFDVAINGPGFFTVETPLGERYTRHGRFQLDAENRLVTGEGHAVQGQAGPITVPIEGGPVTISPDGVISNEQGVVGVLQVVRFDEPQTLRRAANGLYTAEDQQPQPVAIPSVAQGMLEGSNVKGILEMTRMITVSRQYQSVGRMLNNEDERLKQMITTLGKAPGA
ncbi:MAG: flagellar basal-body rod protein FlgF [Alphaproteobacteria bacterium]|nr:flagellar basal-body rod protein FlgF [Alphaproteobacteria bacterium]